jgi:hypothetical protein
MYLSGFVTKIRQLRRLRYLGVFSHVPESFQPINSLYENSPSNQEAEFRSQASTHVACHFLVGAELTKKKLHLTSSLFLAACCVQRYLSISTPSTEARPSYDDSSFFFLLILSHRPLPSSGDHHLPFSPGIYLLLFFPRGHSFSATSKNFDHTHCLSRGRGLCRRRQPHNAPQLDQLFNVNPSSVTRIIARLAP